MKTWAGGDKPGINLTLDMKQCNIIIGGSSETKPPPREVPNNTLNIPIETDTDVAISPVYITTNETPKPGTNPESVLTRETDPQNPDRVKRILQEITIGLDFTEEQRFAIQELNKEYTDCFALSIKGVNAIPGAVHKLKIPEGTTF